MISYQTFYNRSVHFSQVLGTMWYVKQLGMMPWLCMSLKNTVELSGRLPFSQELIAGVVGDNRGGPYALSSHGRGVMV